jgi:hypothetical protein
VLVACWAHDGMSMFCPLAGGRPSIPSSHAHQANPAGHPPIPDRRTRTRLVSSGLAFAQVLSALPGAVLGIPFGLLLFKAAVHGGTWPPATWLAAAALGALAAMAALTVVPARIGARQPAAEVLQAEAA